ncbi:MAG: hypothetical protein ABIP50_03985 [Candidatus Saccharimonadales bacterium]
MTFESEYSSHEPLRASDYEERSETEPYVGAPVAETHVPSPEASEAKTPNPSALRRVGEAAMVQFRILRAVGAKDYLSDPLLTAKEKVHDTIESNVDKGQKKMAEVSKNIHEFPGNAAKKYQESKIQFVDFLTTNVADALIRKSEVAKRRKATRAQSRSQSKQHRSQLASQRVQEIRNNNARRAA